MIESLQVFFFQITEIVFNPIRMGTLASISAHWLPGLLKEFQEQYPEVEFVIHQGDYSSIYEWIKTGAVDFGFVNPEAVTGIETIVLKEGVMLAVLPADHPLGKKDVVPLTELAKEPFILLEEGHYYEPLEAFKAIGYKDRASMPIACKKFIELLRTHLRKLP